MVGLFAVSQGKSADIVPKLKQDLFSTVKVNWMVWLPAQFVNFRCGRELENLTFSWYDGQSHA